MSVASSHVELPARPGSDAGGVKLPYRPELDGVRAVAVYAVVLFHAGLGAFSGGFIGVDVFFVLSGFLITTLLLREAGADGKVSLRRFYARRVRRLLPAAVVAVTATLVASWALFPVSDRGSLVGDARASLLWYANWRAIAQGNEYFNVDAVPSPFLHYWSLSVEEQFYLVWPAVVVVLCLAASRLGRRPEVLVAGIAVIFGVGSIWLGWTMQSDDPVRGYYGTGVRAYQLLAGALLATVPMLVRVHGSRMRGRALQLIGMLGILLLATDVIDVGPWTRGIFAGLATAALLVGLEISSQGGLVHVLSWPPLVRLGQLSYGTYLWHWPIIVLAGVTFDIGDKTLAIVTVLGATAIASLSSEFLEHPIRRARSLDRRPLLVITVGLAVSLVTAAVMPGLVERRVPEVRAAGAAPSAAALTSVDWEEVKRDGGVAPVCAIDDLALCTVVEGDPGQPHLHLVGDSHARSTIRMFEEIARARGYTLTVTVGSGCPWQRGVLYPSSWGEAAEECRDLQPQWFDAIIPALQPDVTFMLSYSFDSPVGEREMRAADGSESALGAAELHELSAERSVDAVLGAGSRVVIIEPLPVSPNNNPLSCLSSGADPAECAFEVDPRPIPAEGIYQAIADDRAGVELLDLDAVTCPALPRCDAVVDGLVVRRDHNHVTASFFESRAATVATMLERRGLID